MEKKMLKKQRTTNFDEEADWLVALGELNIEPSNEGMDEVVAADFQ